MEHASHIIPPNNFKDETTYLNLWNHIGKIKGDKIPLFNDNWNTTTDWQNGKIKVEGSNVSIPNGLSGISNGNSLMYNKIISII